MDVKSLYFCVLHDMALHALRFHPNLYSMYDKNVREFIVISVAFLLEHNYFMFNQTYLQCRGASMGAKFSPSLVNLYMGWWKEEFLFSCTNPYMGTIKRYGRYIDHLILVWDETAADLAYFIANANKNVLNLEFSFESHCSHHLYSNCSFPHFPEVSASRGIHQS